LRRLTKSELGAYRKRWQRENPICPLCERTMGDDTVVDHDHKSGEVRAVVCRWCNSLLGKLENWAGRIGQGIDPQMFLRNVHTYLGPLGPRRGVLYPTHKTEDEKRLARNAKARKARAKARLVAAHTEGE
jgi:hypothetical protein